MPSSSSHSSRDNPSMESHVFHQNHDNPYENHHSTEQINAPKESKTHKMPGTIWALSIAFFLMNVASCIVFACAPLLLKTMGIRMKNIGMIEGTVEGFALTIRSLSGFISDAVGYRKPFISWGYGIVALARFLLAPATLIEMIIASRWIEKLGNGLQASPREAFIGDIVHPSMLGRAYGLNKTFGMAGSSLGSFLMLFISLYYRESFPLKTFLWLSTFMTLLSFLLLFLFVKEKPGSAHSKTSDILDQKSTQPIKKSIILGFFTKISRDIKEFPSIFWKTMIIIFMIKFGYFSGAFLMGQLTESNATFFGYELHNHGALAGSVFLTIQNFACTLLSYPLGKISDALDRRWSVAIGFVFMLIALGLFAFDYLLPANTIYLAIIFYGLQMSMQGALMALLTSTMPQNLHGTGFGLFFLFSGVSIVFTNNFFMGFTSHTTSFLTIGFFVLLAFILLPIWLNNKDYSHNNKKTLH